MLDDALRVERRVNRSATAARERRDVAGVIHLGRAYGLSQLDQRLLRSVPADHEPTAALPQAGVEIVQALDQEPGTRAGSMSAGEQPVVEAEHRNDALVRTQRRVQCGMIGKTQITTKPHERSHSGRE